MYQTHATPREPYSHCSTPLGPHPDEWRDGETCEDCIAYQEYLKDVKHNTGPGALLHRIKNEREGHYTQNMIAKDIFDSAKREGREIQRAGKSWS